LFFIEGSLTCFIALIAVFVLPDFPSNSQSWLSPLEKRLAEKRMVEDAGVGDEKQTETQSSMAVVASALSDGKVWYMAFTITCIIISLSFNAFFPASYPSFHTAQRFNRCSDLSCHDGL
jgi:hypothetical protein